MSYYAFIKNYSCKIQKRNVGMAEQISKKHRHQVITSLNIIVRLGYGAMISVPTIVISYCWTLVMALRSVTLAFEQHAYDHLESVLFGDFLTHSYNIAV